MSESERQRLDALLDLLADEVAERLALRAQTSADEPHPPDPAPFGGGIGAPNESEMDAGRSDPPRSIPSFADRDPSVECLLGPQEAQDEVWPENVTDDRGPVIGSEARATSLLLRLALGILVIVAAVNLPLGAEGRALARSIPSSASLVIRDGLVVKEASRSEFYVYREEAFHWITSLEAFARYGYRWDDVHVVEDGFLAHYAQGRPVYLLLKCNASPHVYRLEDGRKRWLVDLATFQAEGHRWEEVRIQDCGYLRSLPDGESIPPGRGSPPPPLP